MAKRCETCRFWRRAGERTDGECKRYPLTVVEDPESMDVFDRWPLVADIEWCGEWQPKPDAPEDQP